MGRRQRELTGRAYLLEESSAVFLLRLISHATTETGNLLEAIIRNAIDHNATQRGRLVCIPPFMGRRGLWSLTPHHACRRKSRSNRTL